MTRARIRRSAQVLVFLLAAGAAAGAAAPARATERTLTVEPAEGLGNEVVKVSWTGFHPTEPDGRYGVLVQQCSLVPTSLADCFVGQAFPAVEEGTRQTARTGADGTGSALFEVRPAANLPALGCGAAAPCSILVYENDGVPFPADGLPTTALSAELRFASTPSDCPPVTDFDLRADGEASGAAVFYRWAAALCGGDDPLVLDYTETSSNTGREDFLSGLVDVGLTSLPATGDELAAFADHPEFTYAPVDRTALVVAVNMRDPYTGARIDNLTLSPRLVARFVTDTDISSILGDAELRTLNPGIRFPSISISRPLLRAERNADTRLVTQWMVASDSAQRFLAGTDDFGVPVNPAYLGYEYPRDVFENVAQDPSFVPRTGQRNVALRVFYGVRPDGPAPENTEEIGFIGLVDLPTARRFGLPTARIVNAAGEAVAPTDEAVAAGFAAMTPTEAGTLVPDPTTTDPAAYPLVKVDYAMVPTDPADDTARHLVRFLRYAAGDGQSVLPPGYFPLSDELRAETRRVAAKLEPELATTTTTTTVAPIGPTTTTTAVPLTGSAAGGLPVSGGVTVGATGTGSAGGPGKATGVGRVETTRVVLAASAARGVLPFVIAAGLLAAIGAVALAASPAVERLRRRRSA